MTSCVVGRRGDGFAPSTNSAGTCAAFLLDARRPVSAVTSCMSHSGVLPSPRWHAASYTYRAPSSCSEMPSPSISRPCAGPAQDHALAKPGLPRTSFLSCYPPAACTLVACPGRCRRAALCARKGMLPPRYEHRFADGPRSWPARSQAVPGGMVAPHLRVRDSDRSQSWSVPCARRVCLSLATCRAAMAICGHGEAWGGNSARPPRYPACTSTPFYTSPHTFRDTGRRHCESPTPRSWPDRTSRAIANGLRWKYI